MSVKVEISDWNEDKTIETIDSFNLKKLANLLKRLRELGQGAVVVATIFKSEKDYIHISYVGNDKYLIQTERMVKVGSFFRRLVQPSSINYEPKGDLKAYAAIKSYIEQSRTEFESSYS